MSNTNLLKPNSFILNTAPLKLKWDPNWRVFELNTRNWQNSLYERIIRFRREFNSDNFLLDSTGRHFVFIPHNGTISNEVVDHTFQELSNQLDQSVVRDEVNIDNAKIKQDAKLQSLITNALGAILCEYLESKLNFQKIGSGGSVGKFFHHDYSESKLLSRDPKIDIVTVFEFALNLHISDAITPYLSIDVKSKVEGNLNLMELMQSKTKDQRFDIANYSRDQRYWRLSSRIKLPELKQIEEEEFELIEFLEFEKNKGLNCNLISYGSLKELSLESLLSEIGIKPSQYDKVAVLRKRKDSNPNSRYYMITSLLDARITNSYIKDKPFENKFHQMSKPSVIERKKIISTLFTLLQKHGICDKMLEFNSNYPQIAFPSVNKKIQREYGKLPIISTVGVERWGNLQKIIIYHSKKNNSLAENVRREYQSQIKHIANKNNISSIIVEAQEYNYRTIQSTAEKSDLNPNSTIHVFIKGDGKEEPNYAKLKEWFTLDNKKPVQFLKVSSIVGPKLRPTIRTTIPQIIAKTGGLPYNLYPQILDKAIILGLDKGRDSFSTSPSASAGIAAVTPQGEYVAGVSTKIDMTTHDSIDVDEIAPEILGIIKDELKDEVEYIVILRDGSPEIAKQEVKPWLKHLEVHNLNLLFFASRKENPYRVFPKIIDDEKRTRYKLPVILFGKPLPDNEFLVITANPVQGTPRPVLYTLLENTTGFTITDVVQKVIPQIISMSMLCWESPHPTSQPLPLHYADKLAEFVQVTKKKWRSGIEYPMFI